MVIPKVIHYCWFGHNKKSDLVKKCISSWKEYLPDYEIIEWNENNFDVTQNKYIEEAYGAKKWAYVSDYARMKILYDQGGIYFDTDVEVIKPFPKELLELCSFTGIEEFSKLVSPGLVFACSARNELVKEVLDSYKNERFIDAKPEDITTINIRITNILEKYGYKKDNMKQTVKGLTVFPSRVFCGYDAERRIIKIENETISVHHYAGSWLPWHRKIRFKLGTLMRRIKY